MHATVSVPTKGLSLPLVSAGGSGLVITCAALGLLYSVTKFQHYTEVAIAHVADPLSDDEEELTPFDLVRPEPATADVEAVSPPTMRNVEFV